MDYSLLIGIHQVDPLAESGEGGGVRDRLKRVDVLSIRCALGSRRSLQFIHK